MAEEITNKSDNAEVENTPSRHFIEQAIDKDLAEGVYNHVCTRFPPEPNGFLHIGHAKSILLNYGMAKEYNGKFNMRFDDTNPTKERSEFMDSIIEDVKWLGADYEDRLFHASDYFDEMYENAVKLIKKGKAYVSELTAEQMREYRGTLTEPGKDDPNRNRSVEENLKLFEDMKNGKVEDGAMTLRAKIDLASGNFNMRVTDSAKLILKLVGTTDGLLQSDISGEGKSYGTGMFKALIINKVKANLARIIKEENLNILEIDAYLDVISSKLMIDINETLDEYGLTMPEFYVTSIVTPDDDPNFVKLKQQFADKTLKVREEEVRKAEAEAAQQRRIVEAQTEAQLKAVNAQGDADAIRIKAQAEAEAYKMKAEAEAAEMQMKGYTYRDETARQVGLEAMQNGITGNGGGAGGGIGDVASLGVTLGAMGGVINMTRDAMAPIMGESQKVGEGFGNVVNGGVAPGAAPAPGSVPVAPAPVAPVSGGAPAAPVAPAAPAQAPVEAAPAPAADAPWNCPNCGKAGITSRFCPDCGTAKPV